MSLKRIHSLLFLAFCLSSCGFLIESDNTAKSFAKIEEKNSRPLDELYCANTSASRVSKNGQFQNKVSNYSGSIAEQIVQNYWVEMLQNPDYFTSHPKIQIFIKQGNSVRYFENETIENQKTANFTEVLRSFLLKEKSKKNIWQLKNDSNVYTNKSPITSFSLAQFIRNNRNDILEDLMLKNHFLKGDDALAPYESFIPLPIKATLKNTPSPLFTEVNEKNFHSYENESIKLQCNFNLNLFQNFTSSLLDPHQFNSYYFGRTIDKDSFYIVTVSSIVNKPIKMDIETGLISSLPTKNATPFCFKNNRDDRFLVTFSTEGRDPAQHISHFIDYGLFEAENITDLIGHMKFTRHLFLKNPDRLLFESLKAREEQLSFFHTMNIPLYHMDKLGETLMFGKFTPTGQQTFVVDERSEAQVLCQ